jgi:hypothetical protein
VAGGAAGVPGVLGCFQSPGGLVLATNQLRTMAVFSKHFHDQLAMVALYFNHTILDRSTRTAGRAQLLAQHGKGRSIERQPFDKGYTLAAPSFGVARHAHRAIAYERGLGPGLADALRESKPTFGAYTPDIGGIYKVAV